MATKRLGGWIIQDKLYAQIKVADELWYFGRRDDSGERQVSLFFFGWFEREGMKAKMLTITVLWVSVQLGFAI